MMHTNLHILFNNTFSAGRPYFQHIFFSATMASTCSTYRLVAMASLTFLATENMRRLTVKLHIVEYSRQQTSAIP